MRAIANGVIFLRFTRRRMDWNVNEVPVGCLWMLRPDFISPRRHLSKRSDILDGKKVANLMYCFGLKKLFGDFRQ